MIPLFRTLVVGSLLVYYGVITTYLFSASFFGTEVAAVLEHNGRDAWLTVPVWFWWGIQFLWAVAAAGMFFFLRWARTLFFLLIVYSSLVLLAGGLVIQTPLQAGLFYLTNLADGAVLYMAYFSSVASRFSTVRPNATLNPDAP